jgi:hypothetical protein
MIGHDEYMCILVLTKKDNRVEKIITLGWKTLSSHERDVLEAHAAEKGCYISLQDCEEEIEFFSDMINCIGSIIR